MIRNYNKDITKIVATTTTEIQAPFSIFKVGLETDKHTTTVRNYV